MCYLRYLSRSQGDVDVVETSKETDLLCIFAHIFLFGLLHVHYVQKLSGT